MLSIKSLYSGNYFFFKRILLNAVAGIHIRNPLYFGYMLKNKITEKLYTHLLKSSRFFSAKFNHFNIFNFEYTLFITFHEVVCYTMSSLGDARIPLLFLKKHQMLCFMK